MIENINEERLQEILDTIVLPGSSIGVHGIKKGIFSDIAKSIMETGLNNSKQHKGLTGTVAFYGQKESVDCLDILNYYYGMDSNGKIYNIVCAIPEVIETTNGKSYYLGMYEKFEGYGKDDYRAHNMPTHNLDAIPPEFIVGCIVINSNTYQCQFVVNKNYISLKNKEEQMLICDNLLKQIQKYKDLMFVYSLDEEGYKKALFWIELQPNADSDSCYYAKLFLNKYEKLTRNEMKM